MIKLSTLLESNDHLTVYHGTNIKHLNSIKSNGLVSKDYNSPKWYMVATDYESALYHAMPDENEDSVVFEFRIPITNEKWIGYPYLWKGSKMNDNSTWFALKQQIPKEFIKKIHKISYNDWLIQHNKGF